MRFPEVDAYVAKFEELARHADYTQGSKKVVQLFLNGLPPFMYDAVLAPP
jgi:hypothetical protein